VTSIAAGSLAPIVAVALLERFDSSIPIALHLAAASVVTLVAVACARETRGISLAALDLPAASQPLKETRI
jgi:hypothetical protein